MYKSKLKFISCKYLLGIKNSGAVYSRPNLTTKFVRHESKRSLKQRVHFLLNKYTLKHLWYSIMKNTVLGLRQSHSSHGTSPICEITKKIIKRAKKYFFNEQRLFLSRINDYINKASCQTVKYENNITSVKLDSDFFYNLNFEKCATLCERLFNPFTEFLKVLDVNMLPTNTSTNYIINLTNIIENETFCYSLPIIKGYISTNTDYDFETQKTILLKKLQNNNGNEEVTSWPVINSNFKCLANLDVGKNEFVLEFEDCRLNINLEFKSKNTEYHVLPVYIICDGHDGTFQAPVHENNSPESACKRIFLGSQLIQSFTAEKLFESNMGRKTFQLASDLNLGLDCVIFRSRLTLDELYTMKPEEIWEHFGRELMSSSYGSEKRKFLAFLSCTKYMPNDKEPETYEEIVARMQGHVALGGGGLAIFGSGCLHTWPETIEQILPRFLDETKVDKTQFMDDSCYRGTYGSCFSTTLGSVCHELGHAFDLGHSKKGVMGRGFDNMNLVFTLGNQSKDANKNVIMQNEGQHATVSFTRNLNIMYSMSSPIRRPRGHHLIFQSSNSEKIVSKNNIQDRKWNQKQWSTENYNDYEKRRTASKVLSDDLTFWDKSCSALLKYHRWFADNVSENVSPIEYDKFRNTIASPAGIRVIELRGNNGLVLASWEFLNTYLPKQFTLPIQYLNLNNIQMVVAEDSMGNLLKEPFNNF